MSWFDHSRYWLGVLFVTSIPPAIVWWFAVHPFVSFWRRLGKRATFTVIGTVYLGSMVALFLIRDPLIGRDLGFSAWQITTGVLFYGLTTALAIQRKRHLTMRILAGVPEIDPTDEKNRLLQEGIYARIRHPRYVEFILGSLALALVINYVGVWIMYAVTVIGILLIIPLEERELRDRFGQAYVEYCARVPRFVPRLR